MNPYWMDQDEVSSLREGYYAYTPEIKRTLLLLRIQRIHLYNHPTVTGLIQAVLSTIRDESFLSIKDLRLFYACAKNHDSYTVHHDESFWEGFLSRVDVKELLESEYPDLKGLPSSWVREFAMGESKNSKNRGLIG